MVELIGATGHIIRGHVNDCNKDALQKALKNYDSKLYIKWNAKKNNGYGIWEIRREPECKSLLSEGEFQGFQYYTMKYIESDLISHVLDVPVLTYSVLDRIHEMDAWRHTNFGEYLDTQLDEAQDKIEKEKRENIKLALREDRKYIKDYVEYVRSGYNPLWFLK